MNISDINQQIIPYYSPISAKGGRRRRSCKTRKYKRSKTHSKNGRTRRRYH